MTSSQAIQAALNQYATDLQGGSTGEALSKESFTELAANVNGFLQGLTTFTTMANDESISQIRSLLAVNAERFTEVPLRTSSTGIPHQTEHWPSNTVKELDAQLKELENAADGEDSDLTLSTSMLSEKINETLQKQPTFAVMSDSEAYASLQKRVETLKTPPPTPVHEEADDRPAIIEESLDIAEPNEVTEESEVQEEGPSFWKTVAVLGLVGLIIVAPMTAVLAPALMGSSNTTSPTNQTFDFPRGGTRTDFSPTEISIPDQPDVSQNLPPITPIPNPASFFEPPISSLNGTQPLDTHTFQPSFTPTPPSQFNPLNGTQPLDTHTFQPSFTPASSTEVAPYTASETSSYFDTSAPADVRFIDRATLRGDELVPDGVTVYEYDSTAMDQPMGSSPHLVIGSDAEPKAPEFDPVNLMHSRAPSWSRPVPTHSGVHHTAVTQLKALPKPPVESAVITPPTVDTVRSLNPPSYLSPFLQPLALGSRDVCEVPHTNSTNSTK
ncbi:hypothetical protein [Simkania sp.]|uniref:hypothetical protein n=1 Tax=Simkania sp. TaxID=34094 RepID=UPI003B517CF5